jgi:hypothetical protein
MATTQNPHEAAARSAKVRKISAAIDAMAHKGKLDSMSAKFAEGLALLDPKWWEILATSNGIHAPSETTRAQVIDSFRERAALAARQAV